MFRVAVIIPVYNAGTFLDQAVESALRQPETEEILLVEDGSTDGSLDRCLALAQSHPGVQVLRHAQGCNLGAGASRNLGIRRATAPFLAFLDADDYFLPQRFAIAKSLLEHDPAVEGVYEPVDTDFEDSESRARWKIYWTGQKVTMVSRRVGPEKLFEALVSGGRGYFHLDGLTIRRETISRSGMFDETLQLHQDTEFCIRLAAVTRLLPGSGQPVAIRRMHGRSRILAAREHSNVEAIAAFYSQLIAWGETNLGERRRVLLRQAARVGIMRVRGSSYRGRVLISFLLSALYKDPGLIANPAYWKLYRNVTRQ